jgi:hypothetical protein
MIGGKCTLDRAPDQSTQSRAKRKNLTTVPSGRPRRGTRPDSARPVLAKWNGCR